MATEYPPIVATNHTTDGGKVSTCTKIAVEIGYVVDEGNMEGIC